MGRPVHRLPRLARFVALGLLLAPQLVVVVRDLPPTGPIPQAAPIPWSPLAVGLGEPFSIARDSRGNVYVAAPALKLVLRLNPEGQLAQLAVGGSPSVVAVDGADNLYYADLDASQIRRMDARTGMITPIAGGGSTATGQDGGPALEARLLDPVALAVASSGDVYIADPADHKVRVVSGATQVIRTVAGDGIPGDLGDGGPASEARLSGPHGLAFDASGHLYVADRGNHRVRRIDSVTGVISTVAGSGRPGSAGDGGRAAEAELDSPAGLAFDDAGNLLVADSGNRRVRLVSPAGLLRTVGGDGTIHGSPETSDETFDGFGNPIAVVAEAAGMFVVADVARRRLWRVDPAGGVTPLAGDGGLGYCGDAGPAEKASVAPGAIAFSPDGRSLYFTERFRRRVRRVDLDTQTIDTLAGTGVPGDEGDDGPAVEALILRPEGLAVDADGVVYVADREANRIRRITPDGTITTLAGTGESGYEGDDGPAREAKLNGPLALALDGHGSLYVAEGGNRAVRRIRLATGTISTVAGVRDWEHAPPIRDGGSATEGMLESVFSIALETAGRLLIASFRGPLWRLELATGLISKVPVRSCGATAADVAVASMHVAMGPDTQIWLSESVPTRIWKIRSRDGCATIALGEGSSTPTVGPSGPLRIGVSGLALDRDGNLYFSDTAFLRRVDSSGRISNVAGGGPGL